MKKLAILGAGGHGKVVADAALSSNDWTDIVFFDQEFPKILSLEHWKIIGNSTDLINTQQNYQGVFVAIGDNLTRLEKQKQLRLAGCSIVSIIHSAAMVSKLACIATGTLIMPGAVINAFATIGEACIINSNAVVEHDCKLGDGTHICPGALLAGNVNIGNHSTIGLGSCVRQGISISDNVAVGAGAVVVKNLVETGTYIGNPAQKL